MKKSSKRFNRRNRKAEFKAPKLVQFNNTGMLSDFNSGTATNDYIEKSALLLVEGTHIDSAKRTHIFDVDRINEIVDNTNNWLAQGGRIPFQRDHKKDQENNIGDLEGQLEVRIITEADLPNKNLRHLIGKVGAFTSSLIGKGEAVVKDILAKKIKTISPGIDIVANMIKEVSATPTPAIVGLGLFKEADGAISALSIADAEAQMHDLDAQREGYDELCDTFWAVIMNIMSASDEQLRGNDPIQLAQSAIEELEQRLYGMFGLGEEMNEDPNAQTPQSAQPGASPIPDYITKQQGIAPANYRMHEVALANFAYAPNNPLKKAAKAAGIGVAATGVAAGVKYGTPAIRTAIRARKNGASIADAARNAGSAAKGAFRNDLATGIKASRKASRGLGVAASATENGVLKAGRNGLSTGLSKVSKGLARVGKLV